MKVPFLFFFLFIVIISNGQELLKDRPYNIEDINQKDELGRIQGLWYRWWFPYEGKDSPIMDIVNYVDGVPNGYFESYYQNGRISMKGFYKDGQLDSIAYTYWPNGVLLSESCLVNGKINGISKNYDSLGTLIGKYKHINGIIDHTYEDEYTDSTIVPDGYGRLDTITTYNKHSKWNKDVVVKIYGLQFYIRIESYYKNKLAMVKLFDNQGLEYKRIIYWQKKPYSIKDIYYFEDNSRTVKVEHFDRKGILINGNK